MSLYAGRIVARRAKTAAPAAAPRAIRPAPAPRTPLAQVLQLRAAQTARAAAARPEVIQCKKVAPGACAGFANPTEGAEVPKKGTAIPMWSYTYKASAAKEDRAEAMQLATDAYAKAGSAVDKPYLTRKALDSLHKPKNKGVADYRNDGNLPLVDPFVATIVTTYKEGKGTATLELDAQFASQLSGYIIRVTDTGLGVNDTLASRPAYADTIADERARPAKTSFSQFHHKTGQKALKDLLAPVGKTANPAVRETGVDAITKAVAEGGRFEAVKLMGGDLADETIFYADKDKKRRGISFNDLWLCWRRSFGKTYSISVSALKDKVVAGGIKKSSKNEQSSDPDMVQPDVTLAQGVTHFDLVGAKKVVVTPPAPKPAPLSASSASPKPSTATPLAPSNAKPVTPAPSASPPAVISAPSTPPSAPLTVAPKTASTSPVTTALPQQPAPATSVKKLNAKAPAYTPKTTAPPTPKPSATQLKAGSAAAAPAPGPLTAAGSGLPPPLRAGVERLSGFAMDDVRVHRNSPAPARLGALAYTQGSDIHLGPGQEHHLPHEAWHVVQQKQGRVQPTIQMKGVGVNTDSDLEAEADRQGSIAAALAPAGPEAVRREKCAARPVIQGKLQILGTILEEGKQIKKPLPPKLVPYHQSQGVYQIRDDFEDDFKDPVHLLAPDKVYLLGEQHDASKWAEQTKEWSSVDKMVEARKSFPGIVTEQIDPKDQPLESMHAFLLHTTLLARSQLMTLEADKGAIPSAAVVENYLWYIGQILASKVGYTKLTKAILADQSQKPYAAETALLGNLNSKYFNSIEIAKTLAGKLKADIAVKSPGKEVLDRIKDLKELLVGEAATFTALAADLAAAIGIAPGSDKGKAIAAEAASKVAVAPSASAAMSVREAAMAANIKAAKRPLLVKVGDGHVESLGGLVDKSIKVRATDTLGKHTLI